MDYLLRMSVAVCALLALSGCLFFHPLGKMEKNFSLVSPEELAAWEWEVGREYELLQAVYLTDAHVLTLPDEQQTTYRAYRGRGGLPPIEPGMALPDGIKGVLQPGTVLELTTVKRRRWGLGEFYLVGARVRSGKFGGASVRLEDLCQQDSTGVLRIPEVLGIAR